MANPKLPTPQLAPNPSAQKSERAKMMDMKGTKLCPDCGKSVKKCNC